MNILITRTSTDLNKKRNKTIRVRPMGVIAKGIVGSVAFALGFYTATQHMAERYQYDQNKCDQYLEQRLEQVKRDLFAPRMPPAAPPGQPAPYAPGQQGQPGQQGYQQQYQQPDAFTRFEGIIENLFELLAPDLPQLPPQQQAPQQQPAPQQPALPPQVPWQPQQPNLYQPPQNR